MRYHPDDGQHRESSFTRPVAVIIPTYNESENLPIILGPDGPSLGGFVCPFVVIQADLWKTGQLAPGDTVRFVEVLEEYLARAGAGLG